MTNFIQKTHLDIGFSAFNCLLDSQCSLLTSQILGSCIKLKWSNRAYAVYWLRGTLLYPCLKYGTEDDVEQDYVSHSQYINKNANFQKKSLSLWTQQQPVMHRQYSGRWSWKGPFEGSLHICSLNGLVQLSTAFIYRLDQGHPRIYQMSSN